MTGMLARMEPTEAQRKHYAGTVSHALDVLYRLPKDAKLVLDDGSFDGPYWVRSIDVDEDGTVVFS